MSDASALPSNPERNMRWPLVLVLSAFFAGIFFVNEQNFQMLDGSATLSPREYRENRYSSDVDDAEENIEQGSTLRRIAFPLVGMLGITFFFFGKKSTNSHGLLLLAASLYLWSALSIAWSDTPSLSIKRFIVYSACVAGVFGLARTITLRELCWIAALVASCLVGFAVAWEVKQGLFEPWVGVYRFAGSVHPNTEASYCALLTLSIFGLAMMHGRRNVGFALALLVSISLLFLTKSRSSLLGTLVAMFLTWLLSVRAEKRAMGLFLAPTAAIILGAALAVSSAGSTQLQSAASLGRESDGGSDTLGGLNGRVPLWAWCVGPLAESPLIGYGFDAFWTPHRMQAATEDLDWTIPNAHNAVLDVALNLGLIGSGMFTLLALATVVLAASKLLASKDPTLCFPVAASLFALSNSIFESAYSQPTGADSFLIYASLAMAVLLPAQCAQETEQQVGIRMFGESNARVTGWGRPTSAWFEHRSTTRFL